MLFLPMPLDGLLEALALALPARAVAQAFVDVDQELVQMDIVREQLEPL